MLHLPAGVVYALLSVAGLVLLDTLLAFCLALLTHTWQWSKVGQFVGTNVLRYLGGGIALAVAAQLHPSWSSWENPVFYVSAAAVAAKFVLSDIASKVKAIMAVLRQQAAAAHGAQDSAAQSQGKGGPA